MGFLASIFVFCDMGAVWQIWGPILLSATVAARDYTPYKHWSATGLT